MASSAEPPTSVPEDNRKNTGVRVISADSLDSNTAQTPTAINFARVGAQKLWAGTSSRISNLCVERQSEDKIGEKLEFTAETSPGDFIFVPPYMPHQEISALEGEALECVLIRSGGEAVVVNLPDLVTVENPEGVKWIGPTHANLPDHHHHHGYSHEHGDGHTHDHT
ncbi:hypothetical protein BDZ45DRAFT_753327 [Acephala macrosclerotiorum]|nr:hypothetical protein BDZ45DRAFT_753327 [Acephala macrosclerotiorum]